MTDKRMLRVLAALVMCISICAFFSIGAFADTETCTVCGGTGMIVCPSCGGTCGETCKSCNGTGDCPHCNGTTQCPYSESGTTCEFCGGLPDCAVCGADPDLAGCCLNCGGKGTIDCYTCNNTGEIQCTACGGSGYVTTGNSAGNSTETASVFCDYPASALIIGGLIIVIIALCAFIFAGRKSGSKKDQ